MTTTLLRTTTTGLGIALALGVALATSACSRDGGNTEGDTSGSNAPIASGASFSSDDDAVYARFTGWLSRNGIDGAAHPSYDEAYVTSRARDYCGLLGAGELVKLSSEVTFPTQGAPSEPVRDRSRLEVLILEAGTQTYCPANEQTMEAWVQTNVR
jgi:hypothetical protein